MSKTRGTPADQLVRAMADVMRMVAFVRSPGTVPALLQLQELLASPHHPALDYVQAWHNRW